jgi:transposase
VVLLTRCERGASITMADSRTEVILGVDTHADTHTAVVIDHVGRVRGTREVPADPRGYRQLVGWARRFGALRRAGVEGTGSYGAGLARFLLEAGVEVIEVSRPDRQRRRRRGKSDPTDAEAAARAVLAGDATAIAKTRDGIVESIRVLQVTRSSCVKSRTQIANQLKDLVVTGPETIRAELRALRTPARVARIAGWPPTTGMNPTDATRRALGHLASRYRHLTAELRELDRDLKRLTETAAPRLLARPGVGVESAAKLLIAAGDNPHRLRTDAAFAALCGACPVEASSGKITRHRLNRGGDRQANNALWTIAFQRRHRDPATQAYAKRRTPEGKTDRDITRCLKRAIARELHPLILQDLAHARTLVLT